MRSLLRPFRSAVIIVVAVALVSLSAGPVSAGGPPVLSGTPTCEFSDGTFVIIWTLEDFLGPDYLFEITATELSGAATGTVDFVPTSLNGAGETATGMTILPGDTVGDVFLDVNFLVTYVPEQEQFDDSSAVVVPLQGDCEAPPTSPSTEASTTSVAADVVTRPTFTG